MSDDILTRDPYLSMRSAAAYTEFSEKFLRGQLKKIPHVRVNGDDIRIKKSDLDAWMSSFAPQRQLSAKDIADQVAREMGI